ncbi:unnamed protein product [Ectocarpus sp. 6 AP-2014]
MTDVEAQISADEALARRIQANEQQRESTPLISLTNRQSIMNVASINDSNEGNSGGGRIGLGELIQQAGSDEAETQPATRRPVNRATNRNVRHVVIFADDGVRGMNASRLGLLLLTLVNLPLIAAGVVILTLHWQDTDVCDVEHRRKWKWWALLSVVRMMLITPVVMVRWRVEGQREEDRNQAIDHLSSNMRNSLDIVGLVWFVIGHMWLLQNQGCDNPRDSPIYQLCLVYIIITYIHICLPCILLMLLVPVLCFCLPCVIRLMGMLQGPQRRKGARQDEIEKLPVAVKYREVQDMEDDACAICLVEYEAEDELRKLPCRHAFHKTCVDSWLAVNASCPNCRARCFEEEDGEGEEKIADDAPAPVGDNLA